MSESLSPTNVNQDNSAALQTLERRTKICVQNLSYDDLPLEKKLAITRFKSNLDRLSPEELKKLTLALAIKNVGLQLNQQALVKDGLW